MLDPALSGLWENIKSNAKYMGHGPENRIAKINWETIKPTTFRGISAEICEAVVKMKEADVKMLDCINQAIKMLEKKQ